jgi:hypothetical protein
MQKGVLKEILKFYKVGAKGVKWKRGYAYILSGRRDRICGENSYSYALFCARRRWTAIGVGAIRYNTARAPLSIDIVPISVAFLYDARCHLLMHIFLSIVFIHTYLYGFHSQRDNRYYKCHSCN